METNDAKAVKRIQQGNTVELQMRWLRPFGSSLDFRDKFVDQLEMKIRELQSADESGHPPPLELQFFSLQSKELIGSAPSLQTQLLDFNGTVSPDDADSGTSVCTLAASVQ